MRKHSKAVCGYALVGLVAIALLLDGSATTGADDGSGVGRIVFGVLFLSASLSGLLGVLADSDWHVGWALAGFVLPGYSLPFVLHYAAKGYDERRHRGAERAEHAAAVASERAAAEQRTLAEPLAELAARLRRLRADYGELFERLPSCKSARRFLAEYDASGPTPEAAALAEAAARESREALSALVADVPDVGHRDFRGGGCSRRLRLAQAPRAASRERGGRKAER